MLAWSQKASVMKIKWPLQIAGFGLLGLGLATFHAMYLGATAPNPGALIPKEPFIVVEGSQSWVVLPASHFGIRQYTVGQVTSGYLFELGKVPDWVFRSESGQDAHTRGFGWPFPALVGTEVYANNRLIDLPGYLVVRGSHWVPVRVTGGLFANAGFFGLVTGMIACGARRAWVQVSKFRRVRPFACETCGYDMKGLGLVCPEGGSHKV